MVSIPGVLARVTTGEADTRVRATWRGIVPWGLSFGIQLVLLSGLFLTIRSVLDISELSTFSASLLEFTILGVVSAIGIVFTLFLATRLDKRSVSAYGIAASREQLLDLVVGLGIGALTYAVPTAVLIRFGEAELTAPSPFPADSLSVVVLGIAVAVFAFLCQVGFEEIAFRGVMLKNFAEGLTARRGSQQSSVVLALLTSSVLFGVSHVIAQGGGGTEGRSVQLVVTSTLLGILWGGSYVLTGSLSIPFGLHLGYNLWPAVVLQPAETTLLAPALGQVSYGVSQYTLAAGKVLVGSICLMVWLYLSRGEITIREEVTNRVANSTNAPPSGS